MIRPATLADMDSLFGIAVYEVRKYERLRLDVEKIKRGLRHVISSAKHFCWVCVDSQDRPNGVIVGIVNDNLWAQRQSCNIVLWVSDIPGDGVKLLRQLRDWIRSRRAIKVVGFAPDTDDIDPRVWQLAEMMGFKRYGGAYLLYN